MRLLQDAADPELWAERFVVRSWMDYRRQAARRNLLGKRLDEVLQDCHDGSGSPVCRYYFERPARSYREVAHSIP